MKVLWILFFETQLFDPIIVKIVLQSNKYGNITMNMKSWKSIYILYAFFTTIFGISFGSSEKKLIREYNENFNYIKNSTERSPRTVSSKVYTLFIHYFYFP